MNAFLLAAGFGTRLRPLSLELPKPAWPFFGAPLAAHVLRALAAAGARQVVVNLHHLPESLREALEPWLPAGVRVLWSPEDSIQGTGGALVPWRELLSAGTFFLANGDTYQELDLAAMVRRHRETGALATLALRPLPAASSAPIEVDREGRVVGFLGARAPGASPGAPCDFTGVHLLEPEVLAHLPAGPHCINADVHRHLVAKGARLVGFFPPADAFWSDLGTPERYLGAHRELLVRGRVPAAGAGRLVRTDETTADGGRVRAPSYLGAGVRVGTGAVAGPHAVLGSGARVAAGTRVEHSVLWPGATAREPMVGAILSPSGGRMTLPVGKGGAGEA